MELGYFSMPSHPPERDLKEGFEFDLQVIRWLDELSVLLADGGALLLGVDLAGLHCNLTASLPLGLYREFPRPEGLGDLVAICPPAEWVRLVRDRGYLPPGRCDGGGAPLLKRIIAVEGQVVVVDAEGVSVDGHWLLAIGRLRPGRTFEELGAQMPAVGARVYETFEWTDPTARPTGSWN